MTLPVFRSASPGGDAAGNGFTLDTPAGVAENDILIVEIYVETTTAVSATGWTEVTACFGTNGSSGTQRVFWRRATASEPATHNFSWSGGSVWRGWVCGAYSGCVASGTPVEAGRYDESEPGTDTITGQSITTLGADRKVIFVGTFFYSSATSFGNPNTGTRRGNVGALAYLCDNDQAAAGASGNRTIQANNTESGAWTAGMLALIGVTGAAINLSATASASSATPDDVVNRVARALSSVLAGASATPNTGVLAVARPVSAVAAVASNTPDTATLSVAGLVELAATIAPQSSTPDDVVHRVARALAAISGVASAAPDTAALTVARELAATLAAQSAAPNAVVLAVTRILAAALTPVSLTPVVVRLMLGQYALRFYGNGTGNIDRVRIALDVDSESTAVDVGAGDFTIEMRLRCSYADNTSGPGIGDARNSNIFADRDIWGHERGWVAGVTRLSGPDRLVACLGCSGGLNEVWETIYGSSDVGDDAWHHVAITWQQSTRTLRLWVDGAQEGGDLVLSTGVTDLSYPDGYDPGLGQNNPYLVLGAEKHDAGSEFPSYNGLLDELRVSDTRRYTTSFSPPTTPFTPDANAVGLYHFDDGNNIVLTDWATVAGAPTDGELLVGGTPEGPEWVASSAFWTFLSATLAAVSATPDDVSVAVLRDMAGSLGVVSATPDTGVLAVARVAVASIGAASATPDDVALANLVTLLAAIAAESSTPDGVQVRVAHALAVTLDATSVTPDTVALVVVRELQALATAASNATDAAVLSVAREFLATVLAQSATPDDAVLSVSGLVELLATILAASNTPVTSALAVSRSLTATATVASSTNDAAVLRLAMALVASISAESNTNDVPVLAVARALAASIESASSTPNTTVLTFAIALAAMLEAQSATPDDAVLSVSGFVELLATILAASNTPDVSTLAVQRPLVAQTAGSVVTPDTSVLAVLRTMAGAISASSVSPETAALAVARELSATLGGASSTPDTSIINLAIALAAAIASASNTPSASTLAILLHGGTPRVVVTARRPGVTFGARQPGIDFET